MERGRSAGLAARGEASESLDDFDAMVRLHRPRVFRFILASVRDRETAENLTQDCFVRAYQARGQFRGASSVATWVLQIAANLVRSHESSGRLKFWRRALHGAADVSEIAYAIPDQARGQFRGASSVATWVLQIAANLVRSHESSGRLKFWRRALHGAADVSEIAYAIPDRAQSPESMALVQEQVRAIWSAASRLPSRQREVFLLRFVEDMELLEIAEVTGMKEGTVKAHLFRALHAVRAGLEGSK